MTYANSANVTLATLVEQAQAGNDNALGILYETHWPQLTTWLHKRAGSNYDAEGLAQEIFVTVLEKLHTLRSPAAFGGWLYQIALRKLINDLKRGARPLALAEPVAAQTPTALELLLTKEQRQHVRDGLDRLKPLDQDALRRFYLRGDSLIVIAGQLEKPIGTVKRRLHVARKRLAAQLIES